MVGFLITGLVSVLVAFAGLGILGRWMGGLDPAERVGLGGLVGLGLVGTTVGMGGLMGVPVGLGSAGILVLAGCILAVRGKVWEGLGVRKPEGAGLAFVGGVAVLLTFPLVAVLAPSTVMDWDSIAYHLAVPKMWIQDGVTLPYAWEHHSFFPAGMDGLFLPGLMWGGQAGAKAFMWVALLLSLILVFGIGRRVWGETQAWWGPLVLAGSPVVLWESGTAYIDVPHGVFCAAGVWYLGETVWRCSEWFDGAEDSGSADGFLPIGAIMLGLGMGTKYTGIQVVLAAAVVFVVGRLVVKKGSLIAPLARQVVAATVIILVLGGGWYVRNFVVSGNAVYPFFHSLMPSESWDDWRAAIYRDEQQTFGVGRTETGRDPVQIGHGILGLGYQPGRFTNPRQTEGGGFPSGSVGVACLVVLLGAAVSGRMGVREKTVLGWVGLMFLMWFFLSQQSRYMTYLVAAGALLLPALMVRWRPVGVLAAGVAVLQAGYSGWMLYATQTESQLQVVSGKVGEAEYLAATTPFTRVAGDLNGDDSVTRVALFDEVFGFYLDKEYFWANPGHSTLTPYEGMETGADLAAGLWGEPSHVYMNLQFLPREEQEKWYRSAGILEGAGEVYSEEDRVAMFEDLNLKWRWLMADAVRSGAMRLDRSYPFGVVLRVER